jgi:3-methyladenine DNA glycosylase AlkC
MEPFKNLLNPALVRASGVALARAWPAFERRAFERAALAGLEGLEMKARAMQIADALEATLPPSFDGACGVIEAALAPPIALAGVAAGEREVAAQGLAGWIVWPLGEFVARRGIGQPERALQALHALTQRLTAEFAIRPFIVAHPALTLATLQRWTLDPSAHVRRLCSEGSRPRLPWGMRLQALVADPSPTLPILAALQDDHSEYVRRSVANHLNDIAKDHPRVVVDWVRRHLVADATPARRALLAHASRTLIKQGHADMLALWGAGVAFSGRCVLKVSPKAVTVGDSVDLLLTLRSSAATAQSLLIDYAVHHVKADGGTSAKVFKGWKLGLDAGASRTLAKRHSFKAVTTRRYRAGPHVIEVIINGGVAAKARVALSLP